MDVIVVGLGSMGAATAYHLAARGLRVTGLDRFTPPHGRGSHGGGSRIFRTAYAEGAAYVPLLRRAHELWLRAERDSGEPLLTPTGGLLLGRPDTWGVRQTAESARVHDLPHELLDPVEVRRRFPPFAPAPDEVGVYEPAAGVLRPEAAVGAYLRLAAGAGARLRTDLPATGWRARAGSVTVDTAEDPLSADALVLCPGPWAPELLGGLAVPFAVQRRVQHFFASPGPEFDPEHCPVWIWESEPERWTYGMPAAGLPGGDGGPVVKVAFHHGHDPADAAVGAAAIRPGEQRDVVAWLSARLPALSRAPWRAGQPCLYTLTPDGHFVLGRHPDHENVAVAAGFSGHGFKFVPVVGEILADLVSAGSTRHPIGMFAPDRFASADGAAARAGQRSR